jgi:hypothetical protein
MATNTQKILLKRSGVSGSVPTTTNIDLGELALNTYDGKAFMHKSGSTDEVVEFVVAGSTTSGSITIGGNVTAANFIGSGQGLTGVTASMRPDDFDFNSDPFAGTIGYIQASGSLYKVATTQGAVELRYNDTAFGTFTTSSTTLYGIGDVLAFSGSVATRLYDNESALNGTEF